MQAVRVGLLCTYTIYIHTASVLSVKFWLHQCYLWLHQSVQFSFGEVLSYIVVWKSFMSHQTKIHCWGYRHLLPVEI